MYNNHIITVYTEVEDIANAVLILSAHKGGDSNLCSMQSFSMGMVTNIDLWHN